tara:strand:- start:1288 stop:2940 length:1653 start_codon:yes stop_codon:yes gene_type:complete
MATRSPSRHGLYGNSIVLVKTAVKEPRARAPYLSKKDARPHGTAVVVSGHDFGTPGTLQLLLTAYHCVEFATTIWVRCPNSTRELEARLHHAAPHIDAALIRVVDIVQDWDQLFFPVHIVRAFPALGDVVHAVGYGGIGVGLSFTTGVVSGSTEFMTFTSEVNPGCSGGAVLRHAQDRAEEHGGAGALSMVAVIHGYVKGRQNTNIGIPMEAVCSTLRGQPLANGGWVQRPRIFGADNWSPCSPQWIPHFNLQDANVEGVLLHAPDGRGDDSTGQRGTLDALFDAASTNCVLVTKLSLTNGLDEERTYAVRCDGTVHNDLYDQFLPLKYVENVTRVDDSIKVTYYEVDTCATPRDHSVQQEKQTKSVCVRSDPNAYRSYALQFERPPYRLLGGMVIQIAHAGLGYGYDSGGPMTSNALVARGVLVITNVSACSPFVPSPDMVEGAALTMVNGQRVATIDCLDRVTADLRKASGVVKATEGLVDDDLLLVLTCADGTCVSCLLDEAIDCDAVIAKEHTVPQTCLAVARRAVRHASTRRGKQKTPLGAGGGT